MWEGSGQAAGGWLQAAGGRAAALLLTVVQLHHVLHAHIGEVGGRGARSCGREGGREWGPPWAGPRQEARQAITHLLAARPPF